MLIYTTSAALGTSVQEVADVVQPVELFVQLVVETMEQLIPVVTTEVLSVEEERAKVSRDYLLSVGYRAHGGLA